ncbi:MAG: cysteine desulfurase [Lentisphaeria bacterium]|nr:cysteine desulfurase [Lentisphaeria bacterium]NQZ69906.1 cysteine desulfurase [Lentisphaeria bacterium]
MNTIYMDHHATTPLDSDVLDAMLPFLKGNFANPASQHASGNDVSKAVEQARSEIASSINTDPRSIIFTSGATESNNLAIHGVAAFYKEQGNHIITCKTEHPAVLDPCASLEKEGYEISRLAVDQYGMIDLDELRDAITDKTILISLMFANNEIGTIQDIKSIGDIAKEHKVFFHCDAAQAFGKIPIDLDLLGIDLMSISAHKIYGPKGIGALYLRRRNPRVRLEAMQLGGGHERGFRSGTLNVPGIIGFAKASEVAMMSMTQDSVHISKMRNHMQKSIMDSLDNVYLNGHPDRRLPGNLNLSFEDIDGYSLLAKLNGIDMSMGAACSSAISKPSHVLRAIGRSPELCQSGIRIGLGRANSSDEVDYVAQAIVKAVSELRESGNSVDRESCVYV